MSGASQEISAFLPYVLPFAPGCEDPIAEQYVRLAAIEWCEKTRCWRIQDEFNLTSDTSFDVVAIPPYAVLHEVDKAWFNGYELEPKAYNEIASRDWEAGSPRYITTTDIDRIAVVPPGDGSLRISVYLKPTADAALIPAWLLSQWAEPIAVGALARLMLIPGTSYSNPALAAYYASKFADAVASHRSFQIRGQQRAPVRTRPAFF